MGDAYAPCPVDRLTQEFRLLRLKPESDESLIKCDLQTFSPKTCPPYTALSYTWGDKRTAVLESIEINGVRFPVRGNLHDFLRQQLDHQNYGPFWIDAVCIQQSEVHERNHQVQMMRSIYSEARTVLVWLGKESDDSDLAMQMLTTLDPPNFDGFKNPDKEEGRRELAQQMHKVIMWSIKQVRSVSSLCKRRYWSRMWIIQEIMLAKDIEIQCGSEILEWSKLQHLHHYIKSVSSLSDKECSPLLKAIISSPAMTIVSTRWRPIARENLGFLLETCGTHGCEDIRDKLFALAGVATYGSHIVIDYSKSAKDVLLDAFYHEMNRMCWENRWGLTSLINLGGMLEKVFQTPFPISEIRFHKARIEVLMPEKLYEADPRPSEQDFFQAIVPPQEVKHGES